MYFNGNVKKTPIIRKDILHFNFALNFESVHSWQIFFQDSLCTLSFGPPSPRAPAHYFYLNLSMPSISPPTQ